jgi:hypothetical protein
MEKHIQTDPDPNVLLMEERVIKSKSLVKEMEINLERVEEENRILKIELENQKSVQNELEEEIYKLKEHKTTKNNKDDLELVELNQRTIHLMLFAPLSDILVTNRLFQIYLSSSPQIRKDFLLLLKDLLIDKRLVYSICRDNLMTVINFCLQVSISQTNSITSTEIEKKLSGLLVDKILNSKPHIEMITIFLILIKETIPDFQTIVDQSLYLLLKFYLNCSQRFIQISEKIDCFNFLKNVGELFDKRPPERLNDQVVSLEIFDEIFRTLRSMSDEVIQKNVTTAKIFYEVYKNKFDNQVFINYVSNYLISIES